MLVSSPIRMGPVSPRRDAFGQTLDRSRISTSPMTCALMSTYADTATFGAIPRNERIIGRGKFHPTPRTEEPGVRNQNVKLEVVKALFSLVLLASPAFGDQLTDQMTARV